MAMKSYPGKTFINKGIFFLLILLTVLVFLAQMASELFLGVDVLLIYGAKINAAIDQGQFWRLVTPIFLHGSILHLGFNMYALYVLGPSIERAYGRWLFLALFLVSGIYGNLFSYWLMPAVSLGASTAVFGLIAAQAVFIYRNRRLYGQRARAMLMNIGVILLINLLIGLSPGIDNWGHLGGFLGGLAFAWMTAPQFELMPTVFGNRLIAQVHHQKWIVVVLLVGLALIMAILKMLH